MRARTSAGIKPSAARVVFKHCNGAINEAISPDYLAVAIVHWLMALP